MAYVAAVVSVLGASATFFWAAQRHVVDDRLLQNYIVCMAVLVVLLSARLLGLRDADRENDLLRARLEEAEHEWFVLRTHLGLPTDEPPAWAAERRLVD